MAIRLGMEAKLYFCAAGIGGSPTWTELTNVKNVSLALQTGEADVTTRGNSGWKATAATLKEGSIEFEMVWDTADAGFTAIKNAYFGNTLIGLAAMDGTIATNGSQGLWADCMITNFSRDEALEEAITVKVTAKPTYSTNAPHWKTVGP
jgi:acetylornithine/succinyldiaminopimelate/putrescine aminotransferase